MIITVKHSQISGGTNVPLATPSRRPCSVLQLCVYLWFYGLCSVLFVSIDFFGWWRMSCEPLIWVRYKHFRLRKIWLVQIQIRFIFCVAQKLISSDVSRIRRQIRPTRRRRDACVVRGDHRLLRPSDEERGRQLERLLSRPASAAGDSDAPHILGRESSCVKTGSLGADELQVFTILIWTAWTDCLRSPFVRPSVRPTDRLLVGRSGGPPRSVPGNRIKRITWKVLEQWRF